MTVRVIALILAALVLGIGAGCMSDSEDHSKAKQAALTEISLAKNDLKQLEDGLPSSLSSFDDAGYGDYVDQSGIRPSVDDLRDEIESAELLLRDPSQYESLNTFEVGDFELGGVVARSDQFRSQVAALRDRLEIAETQLWQIAALENEFEGPASPGQRLRQRSKMNRCSLQ